MALSHDIVDYLEDALSLQLVVVVLITLGLTILSMHRLIFSPLADFPGPKLAALTQWYEFYWNVVKPGQFTFHLQTLHDRYGPIVRINPWELHICDPDFYETIYDGHGGRRDKVSAHTKWIDNSLAAHGTVDHDLHKMRRTAQNPFFSKRQIQPFADDIQCLVDRLLWRLAMEYKGPKKPVCLSDAYGCLTGDVVMEYCFSKSYNFIASANFHSPFLVATAKLESAIHTLMHFPWLLPLLKSFPEFLLPSDVKLVLDFKKELREQIQDLTTGRNRGYEDVLHPTVFKELLDSNLPPQEKSVDRLQDEGITIIGAGQETVKGSLTMATFYLLRAPTMWQKLRAENLTVFPHPSDPPDLTKLEQLPYLTAVIQEALRLSYDTVARSPRTSPLPLPYGSYTIPAKTPISMNNYCAHHNETLFPSSHAFVPERWLHNPKAARLNTPGAAMSAHEKLLSRYMVAFSRGARSCVGVHLAWAELYIGLANVVRRCELEIFETHYADVGFVRDMFVPHARVGATGLRVLVRDVLV